MQRLKKFGEARLDFPLLGNVARQSRHSGYFALFYHSPQRAIINAHLIRSAPPHSQHSRPRTRLQKLRQHSRHLAARRFSNEFVERMIDYFREGQPHYVGKPAIDDADLAFEGKIEREAVEAVD